MPDLTYREGVYEDAEDSWLMQNELKNIIAKVKPSSLLDMGTGTGIQGLTAKKLGVKRVVCADINPAAVLLAEKNARLNGLEIECVVSDLFSNVGDKFDLIVFNPPYLPGTKFSDLEGGATGTETTIKFLRDAKDHLTKKGVIISIYSSLADKYGLVKRAKAFGYEIRVIEMKKLSQEKLYLAEFKRKK